MTVGALVLEDGTRGMTEESQTRKFSMPRSLRSGVTTAMLVKLGENDIKTVEDLAGCATDDLFGWSERKDGETVRYPGVLDEFDLSRDDTEALIMQARLKAGWIKEEDLAPPPAEEDATAEATATSA